VERAITQNRGEGGLATDTHRILFPSRQPGTGGPKCPMSTAPPSRDASWPYSRFLPSVTPRFVFVNVGEEEDG